MSKGNKRVRLKQDEEKLINDYRRIKDEATKQGVPIEDVKHGWLKSDKSSLFFTNPNYKDEEQKEVETFRNALLKDFSEFSPKYTKVKRKPSSDGHLMVISPADVHIGKLCTSFETGEEYNQQIAVQRVMEGVDGLLNSASGWNLDSIHLIIGNDILHTDTPRRTTTSGTPQDTDGMWYENFLNGVRLYVDVINTLKQVANVNVSYNPSNHDYEIQNTVWIYFCGLFFSKFQIIQIINDHFKLMRFFIHFSQRAF